MAELGTVEQVDTVNEGDFLTADLTIGTTVIPVDNTDIFETETFAGTVQINGTTYTYTSVDTTGSTITLSSGLTAAASINDSVLVYPLTPVKMAYVVLNGGDGDSLSVRVPHNLVAYASLTDGPREPGQGESVTVDAVDGELVLADVVGTQPVFDASTATIVTATDGGERVQIDGDGITLYTNDAVQIQVFPTYVQQATDVAIDSAGNFYVDDRTNKQIVKFDSTGHRVLAFTTTDIPLGVTVDASNNIWVYTSGATSRARKFNTAGTQTASFTYATGSGGIATDVSGNVYLTDTGNFIRKYSAGGTLLLSIATTTTPAGVCVDSAGNVYVTDSITGLVRKFNAAGTSTLTFSTVAAATSIAVDALGNIYVDDPVNSLIRKFDPAGVQLATISTLHYGDGVGYPSGLALDAIGGTVYTLDFYHGAVRGFNNPGTLIASATMTSSLGRLAALDVFLQGNLDVDSITSANGLQLMAEVSAPLKMQSGSYTVPMGGAATASFNIIFPTVFKTVPVVVASGGSGNTAPILITEVSGITTSQFTLTVMTANGATSTATRDHNWIAMVP